MTISQDLSAPLVAVVGATGVQGGSVINALSESDRPYRIRGFTRDASKPASQDLVKRGVELLAVDLVVANKDNVYKAFEGATYSFLVTQFWEHRDSNKEIAEGKLLLDASKAANVKLAVWSGLEPMKRLSGGKYSVPAFDNKAEITEYAKTLGIPVADVQAGTYMQNFLGFMRPTKLDDGTYALRFPSGPGGAGPELRLPVFDAASDYGLFVRKVLEAPEPKPFTSVYAYSEVLSIDELTRVISEVTGKKVAHIKIDSMDEYVKLKAVQGFNFPGLAREAWIGYTCQAEVGYFGNNNIKPSQEGLARPLRTWREFVKLHESELLA